MFCLFLIDPQDDNHLNEKEKIVTDAIVSMFKTRKKKAIRSPSKLPGVENTNFLRKPKNDDSSESSSTKDSGYEELDNDRLTSRRRERTGGSEIESSPVKTRGGEGRKTGTQERFSEHSSPVFNLKDINSIWAIDDEEAEEKENISVETIRNESDVDYLNYDQVSPLTPLSSRTTILD